eukprot:755509-Hanusia_phi.AAC.1
MDPLYAIRPGREEEEEEDLEDFSQPSKRPSTLLLVKDPISPPSLLPRPARRAHLHLPVHEGALLRLRSIPSSSSAAPPLLTGYHAQTPTPRTPRPPAPGLSTSQLSQPPPPRLPLPPRAASSPAAAYPPAASVSASDRRVSSSYPRAEAVEPVELKKRQKAGRRRRQR